MKNYVPEPASANDNASVRVARVCLLTETFYPVVGGGETHARLLAQHLNSLGMRTFVVTRRSSRDLPRSESIGDIEVQRVPLAGMKRFGKYAMVPFSLIELFRRRKEYDVIFVCGFRVLGLPAVLAAVLLHKGCVLRAEAQGEMSGGYASAYRKIPLPVALAFRGWIRFRNWILRQADGYVAISKPIAEELVSCGMDTRRIFKLPNGIDSEKFSPVTADDRPAIRRELGLPVDAVIASYSGKLNRGKGLEHLVRAWVQVSRDHENAHLALVGSGGGQSLSCEDELREFVRQNGISDSVTFTGYVEDVHRYLQASDMFVFPTENEAFGLSLVEAMSCGLPAIAARVGGIPEIVSDGKNAILVPAADTESLVREINNLMKGLPEAGPMSANARRTVCERYSIQSVAARYYELFTSVRASGSRTAVMDWRGSDVGETRQELT